MLYYYYYYYRTYNSLLRMRAIHELKRESNKFIGIPHKRDVI